MLTILALIGFRDNLFEQLTATYESLFMVTNDNPNSTIPVILVQSDSGHRGALLRHLALLRNDPSYL